MKKIVLSLLIIILMATVFVIIMELLDKRIDLVSWCGGIIFFATGWLLGEWWFND